MITKIIEQELKQQGNRIVYNEFYEVKNPFYNSLLASSPEHKNIFLFPIEQITKRTKPIIKLPFKLGRLIYETSKEILE